VAFHHSRFKSLVTGILLVSLLGGCGAAGKIAEIRSRIEAARLEAINAQNTNVPAQRLDSLAAGTARTTLGAGSSVRFTYQASGFAGNIKVNPRDQAVFGASKMQQVITTATPGQYEFRFNGGAGEVTVNLNSANEQTVNTNRNVPITFRPVSGVTLDYTEAGVWATNRGTTTQSSMGGFYFGNETRTRDLPQVNTNFAYNGKMVGEYRSGMVNSAVSGNVALTANFNTNSLNGSITGITLDELAGTPAFNDLTFNATMTDGRINAGTQLTAGASPAGAAANSVLSTGETGPVNGRFYGPNAEEFAGSFRIVENRGANNQNRAISGAFGARR
jgi:Tfp pilus assembly protein FimT